MPDPLFLLASGRRRDSTRQDISPVSRLPVSEGMGGEVPFTSSNLMYPGNPQFNRLYQLAHIRFNVPENLRIKVKTEQQIADLLHFNRGGIQ